MNNSVHQKILTKTKQSLILMKELTYVDDEKTKYRRKRRKIPRMAIQLDDYIGMGMICGLNEQEATLQAFEFFGNKRSVSI